MAFDVIRMQRDGESNSSAQALKEDFLLIHTCIATGAEYRCTDCTLELLQDHRVLAAPL